MTEKQFRSELNEIRSTGDWGKAEKYVSDYFKIKSKSFLLKLRSFSII